MTSNPIFTYRVGHDRRSKTEKQNNMHGGVNQLLRKNGLSPEGNSYAAIQKAYKAGLIDKETKDRCCQINHDGNDGKHEWGQVKN
jgi:hypothetical protein